MSPTHSIIITGGNAGLGFETAKVIALDKDAMVVIASRNPQLGRDAVARLTAFGGHAAFLPLDLASQASIRELAEAYRKAGLPPLKGIICNAGMQNVAAPTKTIEGYELTFAVNHLGHYLLTRLLLDDMEQDGRITFVSSGTHDPAERLPVPSAVYEDAETVAHDFESVPKSGLAALCNFQALQHLLHLRTFAPPFRIGRSPPGLDQGECHRSRPYARDGTDSLLFRPAAMDCAKRDAMAAADKRQRPFAGNVGQARRCANNRRRCSAGWPLFLQWQSSSFVGSFIRRGQGSRIVGLKRGNDRPICRRLKP